MKVLVAYLSLTGNTRKVAEAIYQGIQSDRELKPMDEVSGLDGYDLAFIGFPIHGIGQPAQEAGDFLKTHGKGKKVALFVTHSASEDSPYLPPWLENCRKAAQSTQLLGMFNCQGQIALEQVDLMLQDPDPRTLEILRLVVHSSLGKPDAASLAKAREFAVEMVGKARA